MRIDLHAHTTHSDGTLSPAELVARAKQRGLGALAVTDHDTTSGLAEARRTGRALGVRILDGSEVTAALPSGISHILAYGFDVADVGLQDLLARVRRGRDERNTAILARLRELGAPVEAEAVARHATGSVIARPHIAKAVVEAGHADDVREAFRRYLKDGGPAHVVADVPAAEEVIATVTAAGGVTVLAHPRSLKMGQRRGYRQVFERLAAAGLSGIEVGHPSHDANHRRMFADLAGALGLVCSAGSDFHGANKPHLELGCGDGTIQVTEATWDALAARRPGAA